MPPQRGPRPRGRRPQRAPQPIPEAAPAVAVAEPTTSVVTLPKTIQVGDLARALDASVVDVIRGLVNIGLMVSINETVDFETASLVANALEPAHVVRVDIVPEDKTAYVVVPDRQLSLAIGKEGQNARLAAKLTGWRIDIRSESEVRAELEPEPEPEPVAVAEAVPASEVVEEAIRHDLVAEVEAESAAADEEDLDEEDRALLGGKKKRERR